MKKPAIKTFWFCQRPTPEKFVGQYSEPEKVEIRADFEKIGRNYKWGLIILQVIFFGALAFFMLGFFNSTSPLWLLCLACSVFLAAAILGFFWPRLYCPGCLIVMDQGFGSFCPECGGKLSFGILKGTKCCDCGNELRRGRGRSYTIKFCSYCGVQVHEKGFWPRLTKKSKP